jgi:hypothetical protein
MQADDEIVDAVHIQPWRRAARGQEVPGRFNVVLIRVNESSNTSIHGTSPLHALHAVMTTDARFCTTAFQAAQIRVVFSVNVRSWQYLFRNSEPCP